MTGYFRGPSLFAHVVILGLILAVAVPQVAEWIDSTGWALAIGMAFAVCYGILAVLLSIRR